MAAAIVAPLALWMASPASAASCVSASNGDWGNTLTWSGCGGLIPDSGDSVTIDGESVTLSAAQTAGALTLSTGALTGNGSVTASGTFTKSGSNTFSLVNGADLILNAPGSIADGGFLMSATGSGALEPTLQINSTLTVAAAAADNLFVDFVDDLSPGPLVLIGAGGQLLNQHPGTTTIAFPIDNDGIVESQSGELLLEGGTGGATSSGSYRATASNKLVLASKTFTLGATSSLTGAGAIVVGVAGALSGPSVTVPGGATISPNTLSVSNGGLNVAGSGAFTFTTLNVGPASSNGGGASLTSTRNINPGGSGGAGTVTVTAGSLQGDHTLTVDSLDTFTKTTSPEFDIGNGVDVILDAAASLVQGRICLASNATLQINHTFTIGGSADSRPFSCSPATPAIRVGPFGQLLNQRAGPTTLETPIENDGIIQSQNGALFLDGGTAGATSDGSYRATVGDSLFLQGGEVLSTTASLSGQGEIGTQDLVVPDGATVTPSTLTVGGTLTVNGAGAFSFTTLNIDFGTLDNNRADISPGGAGAGAVTVHSGAISGEHTFTVDATDTFAKINPNDFTISEGADVILNAPASLSGGSICMADDPSTTLAINSTFTIQLVNGVSDTPFSCVTSTAAVKIGVAGQLINQRPSATFRTPIDNDGIVESQTGKLTLEGGTAGASSSGSYRATAGDALRFGGTGTFSFGAGSSLTGAGEIVASTTSLVVPNGVPLTPGTLTAESGSLTVGGSGAFSFTNLRITGGTFDNARAAAISPGGAGAGTLFTSAGAITGNQTVTVDSLDTFTKTGAGELTIQGGTDVILNGAALLDGGSICMADDAGTTLQINATFTINHVNSTSQQPLDCPTSVARVLIGAGGQLVNVLGAGAISTPIDNDGIVESQAGELLLDGGTAGSTSSGSYRATVGDTLRFAGAGAFTLGASASLTGGGTIVADATDLTVPGGATITPATLTVASGLLEVSGTGAFAPSTLNISGGTLSSVRDVTPAGAGAGTLNTTAGEISGNHTVTADSLDTFTKTTAGTFTVGKGTDLVLDSAATLDGGRICISDNPSTTLQVNASLTIAAAADATPFSCSTDDAALLVAKDAQLVDQHPGTTTVKTKLDNDGIVEAQDGQLVLSGGTGSVTSAGSYRATAGDALRFSGADKFTLGATASLTGAGEIVADAAAVNVPGGATITPATLTVSAGTLSVSGSGAFIPTTLNIAGGTLSNARDLSPAGAGAGTVNTTAGTITGNHTLTVDGLDTFTKSTGGALAIRAGADLILNSAASIAGGQVCVPDGTVQINSSFVIAAGADANPFNCTSTAPTLLIGAGGTFSRGATGASTISTRTRNAGGAVTADAGGTLNFSSAYEQTAGTTTIAAGGSVSADAHAVSGGSVIADGQMSGDTTLTGGAVLGGGGGLTGALVNTSGFVRPGASPGTLSITGDFTQGAGGALEVEVDGPAQFDLLSVSGAAILGGTLAVERDPAFVPVFPAAFQVLTSASTSGTFATVTGVALPDGRALADDYPASAPFGARLIVPPPPVPQNTSAPLITGTPAVGQVMTCQPGAWTNEPTFTFEWLRDGQAIAGATQPTYTLVADDAAHEVACRVTASNAGGSASAITNAAAIPAVVVPTTPATPAVVAATTTGSPVPVTPVASAPTKQEVQLASATLDAVAKALGLPSARTCLSRRKFTIRLKQPAGVTIKRASITVAGKVVKATKKAGSFVAVVDLRGRRQGRFSISVTITTASGKTIKGRRAYRTCASKRRS